MADSKFSDLTAASGLADADLSPLIQSATPKKMTLAQLVAYLQTKGMPRVARLAADHAISATAATEVMQLASLEPGTYAVTIHLILQSATLTVSPMLGLNFTGTAAVRKMTFSYQDSGGLATGTGTIDDVGTTAGSMMSGITVTAFTTTAPNMGATGGVGAINADCHAIIDAILIVTATGDLELWHGSETATSTTVKAGTSIVAIRTV